MNIFQKLLFLLLYCCGGGIVVIVIIMCSYRKALEMHVNIGKDPLHCCTNEPCIIFMDKPPTKPIP